MGTMDGTDFVRGDNFNFRHMNNLKNCWKGASAPTDPQAGMLWRDTGTGYLKVYTGSEWKALGSEFGVVPEGTIVPWAGGYFTNGSNGGYTYQLGSANTVAGANSYLNSLGWYVCNGAALNDGDSTIFNGASRYLPNLTDDRFFMGDTAVGATGGASTDSHTHQLNIGDTQTGDNATNVGCDVAGSDTTHPDSDHYHSVDFDNLATSGAASNDENRPAFLSCFYIMKVK